MRSGALWLVYPAIYQIIPSSNFTPDMTEDEAYWAEVEENAIAGGAGFREPEEHYVYW
jgi:hypothetical protein